MMMITRLKVKSCETIGDMQVVVFNPVDAGESDNGIRVPDQVTAFVPADIYDFSAEIGNVIDRDTWESGKEFSLYYQTLDNMLGSDGDTVHYFFGDKETMVKCTEHVVSSLKANPNNVLGQIADNYSCVSVFEYYLGDKTLLVHSGENGYISDELDLENDDEDSDEMPYKQFEDYPLEDIDPEVSVVFAGAQYGDASLLELIEAYAVLKLDASEKILCVSKKDIEKNFESENYLREYADFDNSFGILKAIVDNVLNYKNGLDFENTVNVYDGMDKVFEHTISVYNK